MGSFSFDFFAVNHSIPDGVGVFIRTPAGNVVHTGDFKLDQTPIDGRLVDYGALTKFAKMGVDLLMSDSTNAETPGVTRSEASVGPVLREIIEKAEGRVIAASFSSHVHRVQQICDAAVGAGRKVVVTGRSMITNTKIARELGYLIDRRQGHRRGRAGVQATRRGRCWSCARAARGSLSRRWRAWPTATTRR